MMGDTRPADLYSARLAVTQKDFPVEKTLKDPLLYLLGATQNDRGAPVEREISFVYLPFVS